MKNTINENFIETEDEMLAEYDLDFSKSRPNKYAAILKEQERLVKLEPDVFIVFNTSEKVNNTLRAIINAYPK
ncbi:MAG TPA: hypothetical protein PKY56_09330 [Candidatus Kapabacteria bacterium]|nr:hypothetical protein [Candidatus Kapabacteria bacterium]